MERQGFRSTAVKYFFLEKCPDCYTPHTDKKVFAKKLTTPKNVIIMANINRLKFIKPLSFYAKN